MNHDTWLSLRDGHPGLGCFGVQVRQAVCRLLKDASCEMYFNYASIGTSAIIPNAGAAAIAFGDPAKKQLALATRGEATFVRVNDFTRALMTQIDPGVSLKQTSIAYGEHGELWTASEMEYSIYTDPTLNEELIDDRGPHGLGYLELDDTGKPTRTRRYVRKAPDTTSVEVIAGLPSNAVRRAGTATALSTSATSGSRVTRTAAAPPRRAAAPASSARAASPVSPASESQHPPNRRNASFSSASRWFGWAMAARATAR